MSITIEQIKDLRQRTGAGVNAVRVALEDAKGDEDKAIQLLREQGVAKAAKRAGKEAKNGIIGVYVHGDQRMAVLVEVATETDFAAKSEEMKKFANDIALHIAAVDPLYTSVELIPEDILENEKKVFAKDIEGKPENIAEKILEGKLKKFYSETVLSYQSLFTNDEITVQDYMNEMVAKLGEKMEITKFVKMKLGSPVNECGIK